MIEILIWAGFFVLILFFIALDLGVFHRRPHAIRIREALGWTVLWIVAALVFNVAVYFFYEHHWMVWGESPPPDAGWEAAIQFFTAYLVEKSLSVDNIFVIAVIFAFFRVPAALQHRVLFWGILGAVVLRGIMIAAGTVMIHYLDWVTYIFGALLLYSAYRMAFMGDEDVDPSKNRLVRLARRFFPVVTEFQGQRFFVKRDGRWAMTPLFLALLVVESSDVMFAVDSIPAVLAVTRDPFIVFTSNVFAILGLRSLYFAVAGLMELFEHLRASLVVLLAYIGVKMLLAHHFPIPNYISLLVIGSILGVGVVASIISMALKPKPPAKTQPINPMVEPDNSGVGLEAASAVERRWEHDLADQSVNEPHS
ncbi:MAG: membrane protein [Pirellulaceae bacterium]|nr:MAG: membrane protein [Pirellulaceae bacterium]